jgi:protein-S-isoprenylcysteine O-methyltransferase Ste14
MALVVAGMNDVLNSQGYTQAAWRNRVPVEAWALLGVISIFCNLMIGYGAQTRSPALLLILPVVLSISLFLIADIDSPRRGLVRVRPQNLQSLADSLHPAPNP